MSEASLLKVLERVNSDEKFRKKLEEEPGPVLEEFELSTAEVAALVSADEDALRRLSGQDTGGYWTGALVYFRVWNPNMYFQIIRSSGTDCVTHAATSYPKCFVGPC
jgi:hypothetical protein